MRVSRLDGSLFGEAGGGDFGKIGCELPICDGGGSRSGVLLRGLVIVGAGRVATNPVGEKTHQWAKKATGLAKRGPGIEKKTSIQVR